MQTIFLPWCGRFFRLLHFWIDLFSVDVISWTFFPITGRRATSSTAAVLLAVLLSGGSSRAMLASARSLVYVLSLH